MKKRTTFILIALFWFVAIAGFIGYKEYALNTGTEVILATVPVDPYDLFRGDYVILNYDISQIQIPADQYTPGDKVYVKLEEELPVGLTRGIQVSKEKPTGLFVKGQIKNIQSHIKDIEKYWDQDLTADEQDALERITTATIEYGIESYFVPEGRGYELEELRGNELTVKVSISNGNAVIKELLKNGEPISFNKPF